MLFEMNQEIWNSIFKLTQDTLDFKQPLTHDILSNPNHEFVKTLVYIYSMESFVFREMNKASRLKDESKIKFFGAYASALGYLVHCSNSNQSGLPS